jgi:hypothetical protein
MEVQIVNSKGTRNKKALRDVGDKMGVHQLSAQPFLPLICLKKIP